MPTSPYWNHSSGKALMTVFQRETGFDIGFVVAVGLVPLPFELQQIPDFRKAENRHNDSLLIGYASEEQDAK